MTLTWPGADGPDGLDQDPRGLPVVAGPPPGRPPAALVAGRPHHAEIDVEPDLVRLVERDVSALLDAQVAHGHAAVPLGGHDLGGRLELTDGRRRAPSSPPRCRRCSRTGTSGLKLGSSKCAISRRQVERVASPVAGRPTCRWNARTAARVDAPKTPSTATSRRRLARSSRWRALTAGPVSPMRSGRMRAFQVPCPTIPFARKRHRGLEGVHGIGRRRIEDPIDRHGEAAIAEQQLDRLHVRALVSDALDREPCRCGGGGGHGGGGHSQQEGPEGQEQEWAKQARHSAQGSGAGSAARSTG